ncbi:MAG: 50S ribosomal protein L7Ae-like protein [Firmicutes bacterium]|nr:50S ribosomal protein L7Ae-like protein [Bacillota bacterium]
MLATLQKTKAKVIGAKQTTRALNLDKVACCFVALDAQEHVTEPIRRLCEKRHVEIIEVPSMKELGVACGIDVGAAVAAILIEEHTA